MGKYVLAIDQGTSSTRAIIFDKNQNVIKVAQKPLQNFFPHPGWVEQDANEIRMTTLEVITSVFSDNDIKPEEIECIGITNQRETTVVWDKRTGIPVYNAIVWQSRQTSDIVAKMKEEGLEPTFKEKTGLILDPYFSGSKIRWILDHVEGAKDNPNLIFGTVDTWLLWNLTGGEVHATDVTNASRTLLFNIHTLNWDDELLKIFNIPRHMLPEIKATSCTFGYIDPKFFFGTKCPITSLVGDQQAALFGESCFNRSDIKNTYGTGGFILVNTGDKPIISNSGLLSTVAWKIKDEVKYALEGSIFVSGSLIQWIREQMQFIKDSSETENIALKVGDNDGVVVVPAFVGMGAPYWNDKCKGAIFGLTRGTTQAHIVRASLEAMAYQTKDLTLLMEKDINQKITELKVDGGASVNNFLTKFQADILEIPVVKSKHKESTALGAARLAGLETGFYTKDDFANEEFTVVNPDMDHETVEKNYNNWKRAVNACMKY